MAKKLLLSLASLVLALLAVEGALRIAGMGSAGRGSPWFAGGNHPRFLFQADADAGYTLRPGFRGIEIAATGEFRAPIEIDGRGLREQAQPAAGGPAAAGRAETGPAVLAVGDSMTFGEGVAAESTWTARAAAELGVPVWNGGVPGYDNLQMAVHARRLAATLHPALVLMVFLPQWDLGRCINPFIYRDGYIVSQSYADRVVLAGGNLYAEQTKLPVLGTLTAYLQGYSNLGRMLLPRLHDALTGSRKQASRDEAEMEREHAGWSTCGAAIGAAARDLAAQGSGLLVVFIESTTEANRRDTRFVSEALRGAGVDFVRLDDLLPERLDHALLRYPLDEHWNVRGHAAVAAALVPLLRERLHPEARRGR